MVFKRYSFGQKLRRNRINMSIDRIVQIFMLGAGFSFMLLLVTLCTPRQIGPTKPPADSRSLSAAQPITDTPQEGVPMLAYYYMCFDPQSGERAKMDYPLLGRYSSDDADVMRQQIQWAEAAGIDGFIVSWKGTEKLNRRLDQLVEIANEEHFKLAIIYEGLDFDRNPIPIDQVD